MISNSDDIPNPNRMDFAGIAYVGLGALLAIAGLWQERKDKLTKLLKEASHGRR